MMYFCLNPTRIMKAVVIVMFFLPVFCLAQVKSVDSLEQKHLNWYNLHPDSDNVMGTGTNKVWTELPERRTPKKTIIVAVIDSGIDIDHDDLKESIWTNEDEIPNNKIDDDRNGFVDDVHGWNFIGNDKGENINYENMEFTRIYRAGPSHPDFDRAKKAYLAEVAKRKTEKSNLEEFEKAYIKAKKVIWYGTGITVNSLKEMDPIPLDASQDVLAAKRWLVSRYELGFSDEMLQQLKKNNSEYFDYFLNVSFDPRKTIGDNPEVMDGIYGNPDVEGPRADHGTAVAGVIAAVRNNGIGIDGIAPHVKIMCLRSTPRGDERDKDVANAIRYAVDNGAHIVNMSFGKPFSPEKHLVDEAVKYAEQKNVLLVHGAGNDARNIDLEPSFPNDAYLDKVEATNWITVGASGASIDETLPAVFSNYGKKHVDIFAPGVNIISLDSGNTYNMVDGTSLASPVVAGVAALILSYHPELTPAQLIDVLLLSATKMDKGKVLIPGFEEERKKTRLKDLSKSGGVVNAYEALKKADELYTRN